MRIWSRTPLTFFTSSSVALGKADAVLLAFVQRADNLGLALAGAVGERGHHGHVEHHGIDALAEQFKEHAVVVGELLQFLRFAEILHKRHGRGAGLDGQRPCPRGLQPC